MVKCNRCDTKDPPRMIEDSINGDVICTRCGLVCANDNIYDNVSIYNNKKKWVDEIVRKRKINPFKYRKDYFRKKLSSIEEENELHEFIPNDIIEDIILKLDTESIYEKLKKKFIKYPFKKNIKRIMRNVRLDKKLAMKYKSIRNGLPLNNLTRTNYNIKYPYLQKKLCEHYNLDFDLRRIPTCVFDCINRIRDGLLSHYNDFLIHMKHRSKFDKSLNYYIRKNVPSTTCTFYYILLVLSPCLYIKYKHVIEHPLAKTSYKNYGIINHLVLYKYGSILEHRQVMIKSIIPEYFKSNLYIKEYCEDIDFKTEFLKLTNLIRNDKGEIHNINILIEIKKELGL